MSEAFFLLLGVSLGALLMWFLLVTRPVMVWLKPAPKGIRFYVIQHDGAVYAETTSNLNRARAIARELSAKGKAAVRVIEYAPRSRVEWRA